MRNAFGFQFNEDTLRQSLQEITRQKEIDPHGIYALEFSVTVIPDGIGFDFLEPHASIVKILTEEIVKGVQYAGTTTTEMVEAIPVEEHMVDELPTPGAAAWLTPIVQEEEHIV